MKSKTPKQETETPDPRHREFTLKWCESYQKQFGRAYVHAGPKDGSPLKAFLKNAPAVTAKDWVRVALSTWEGKDPWLRNNVVTIAMLCAMWQRCVHQDDQDPKSTTTPKRRW